MMIDLKIKLPEIKFTPGNLKLHLAKDGHQITTSRDEVKGEIGDLVYIRNAGIYEIVDITAYSSLGECCQNVYDDEGFVDMFQMYEELTRIYGKSKKEMYVHTLQKVNVGYDE